MDRAELAALDYCYVTTRGRRSGGSHSVEIWFALEGDVLYLLSGGGEASDWVQNLIAEPTVGVRLGELDAICRARVVDDPEEDALARRLLLDKYGPRYGGDLEEWGRTAMPVALDLPAELQPPAAPA